MSDYAVIIACRMSSERLPGKALAVYASDGTTNLAQIVGRWRASDREPNIVIATTDGAEDAPIVAEAKRLGLPCYRGSRDDVVGRMDGAIRAFAPDAKYVARGMSDSPLVDVGLADWRLDVLADTGVDGLHYGMYCDAAGKWHDNHERLTYAATTDIWSRAAWDTIARESAGEEREHPGAYYWRQLNKFSTVSLTLLRREYLRPDIRTELDTPEDLAMFEQLWMDYRNEIRENFVEVADSENHDETDLFDWPCIPTLWAMTYLAAHPDIVAFNSDVKLKTQSAAQWTRGRYFYCKSCQARAGSVVDGNLVVQCQKCGSPIKFYAHPPLRKHRNE